MILIYGYGAMTSAMVEGWLRAGFNPAALTIYNPRPKPVPDGTHFTTEPPTREFTYVVLGFKPAMLADIAPEMQRFAGPKTDILSVLAGVELATLRRHFPRAKAVVRFMPNLAVAIGQSPNTLMAEGLDDAGWSAVNRLAQLLGTAEWLEDERHFNLVTALAGSGPAFVYRFIDALAAGAEELGLERETAQRITLQMVSGAAQLAASHPLSPADLASKVASPGGMTRSGLDVLDGDDALVELARETLRATRDRGAELGRG